MILAQRKVHALQQNERPDKLGLLPPIKRFKILRTLHDSLMGRTYCANDLLLEKLVVVKVSYLCLMKNGVSMSGRRVPEDPLQECQILKKLTNKPHIVKLIDEMVDENFHWTVLEFCKHSDFFDLLKRDEKFSDETAKAFFRQLVEGVASIHIEGFAHMDLSLENLLLDGDENLRICDFGLARRIPANGVISDGCAIGKTSYMAPEVFDCRAYNPIQADIYTLGVILFLMLTGRPPYSVPSRNDSNFDSISRFALKSILKHYGLLDKLEKSSIALMEKLLAPDPRKRPCINDILMDPWLSNK